jgi:hypothetical protein
MTWSSRASHRYINKGAVMPLAISTLMMEMETVSQMLDYNAVFIQLLPEKISLHSVTMKA